MMKDYRLLITTLFSVALLGCASSSEQAKTTFDKENDPRIGEEVRHVCYTRNISGWSGVENDDDALLVHLRNKETYKLELIGACQPDWAMSKIAVITKAATGCMSAGDKVVTDAQNNPKHNRQTSCSIRKIYQWKKDVPYENLIEDGSVGE